ncbi:MAG TPA: ABC transporter permease [Thermomicrobiales bacterium]|nr:ABC transporter permease [Thermomicrobiales bacterium]
MTAASERSAVSTQTAVPAGLAGAGEGLPGEFAGRPARGPWAVALHRLKRAHLAILGGVILIVLVLAAVFAGSIAPYGENEIDLFNITAPPSNAHLLGTDELGRDELSRLFYGGRISLLVGVATALLATAIGIAVGAVAGYYGGWLDAALMRFVDVMLAFPAIFLLLILFSIVGTSVASVIVFLGLFSWMWLARIIRGEFMSLKQRDFVEAARSIGVPDGRLMVRHLLPNVTAAIIVSLTLDVAYAMLAEASLSFLGFGVPPGTPTWGNMLNAARPNFVTAPLLAIAPGLTLTIAVLAINFVGDGLRDAFDPRGATS